MVNLVHSSIMKILVPAILLWTCFAPCSTVASDTEIDGLVIDQTQTRIGYEFYSTFSLHWEAPVQNGVDDYTITVIERASPQWGSWIWIKINDAYMYRKILQPRQGEVENEARKAVGTVKKYLVTEYLYQKKLLDEDMSESGI